MAATLSSGLVATTVYTALSVTAMPVIANVGEIVYVGQGESTVEQFVVSSHVSVGDTTIHVNSRAATNNHSIGENVAPKYTLTAIGRTLTPSLTPRTKRL